MSKDSVGSTGCFGKLCRQAVIKKQMGEDSRFMQLVWRCHMEEEKRLPKNIRQMAEKEDRVRVYLEDYVYTFIHKLGCEDGARTGILLGNRMIAENRRCWFVKGAVELDKSCEQQNGVFSEDMWEQTQAVIQEFFSDCSVCGWFISGTEDHFPDKEQVKKTHLQAFSGENCLMYWKEGEEDSFWMEEEGKLIHLRGYYVYYEKNFQMQNYMLSRKEEPAESVSDQAAQNFRKIMREKQEKQSSQTQTGIWMKAGVAAAVVLLGGAIAISRGIEAKKQDASVHALAVGASVERQSGGIFEDLYTQQSSEGMTVETKQEAVHTEPERQETEAEKDAGTDAEAQRSEEADIAKESEADVAAEESEALQAAGKDLFSGDMLFYKDGLGASVYRVTAAKESSTEETEGSMEEKEDQTEEAGEKQTAEEKSKEQDNEAVDAAASGRPTSYTVQPGDTLIGISRKFYGSSDMVIQLKDANGLSDINKIYIGQELVLP